MEEKKKWQGGNSETGYGGDTPRLIGKAGGSMQIITNQFQKELKKHGTSGFPVLISYEQLSRYESGSFLWHWHPEIELTLVRRGRMVYHVNQETYLLREGNVLFGNANALHAGNMYRQEDCAYISVTFDPRMIYGFQESTIYRKYVEPVLLDPTLASIHLDGGQGWHGEVVGELERIIALGKEQPEYYEMDVTASLQKIWKALFSNHRPDREYSLRDQVEDQRIKEILQFFEENYEKQITLQDISGHIHLCASECSRLFKKYMRVSLFSFLQEYRIERSLEELGNGEYSITQVAVRAGFSDPNYYSKVFSKVKGCSPREYRKRYYSHG